jgi:peptide/nickel transport system substrate-binding protein
VTYIALNTARPLFADARVRRAVSFAIDRAALAAQAGPDFDAMRPTDQYLAPQIPGYRHVTLYPLRGDVARARRLAGRRHRHATLMTFDFAPFTTWAAIVRANLARIGIDVTIRALSLPEYTARLGDPHAGYDLAFFFWYADFPDPHNVLNHLLRGSRLPADETNNYTFFDDPTYNRRLDAASRLSGPARYAAYARLDADLAGRASPLIAFGIPVQRDLFSARVGCQVYQPVTGMDLAELCLEHR